MNDCQFAVNRFIGEERMGTRTGCNLTNEPTWVIDPIDGTTNFVHRYRLTDISNINSTVLINNTTLIKLDWVRLFSSSSIPFNLLFIKLYQN